MSESKLKVAIVGAESGLAGLAKFQAEKGGHEVLTLVGTNREQNLDRLSTEEATVLIQDQIDLVTESDVVITVHNRFGTPADRGSSFLAGFAYAKGIPVIVLGAHLDIGLYAPRTLPVTIEKLGDLLKTYAGLNKDLDAKIAKAILGGELSLHPQTPNGSNDNGDESLSLNDSTGGPASGHPGGSTGTVDPVADGSHI